MIPRSLETEILRLHQTEHWPVGTIAAQLRVHHGTVRRVLSEAGVPAAPPEHWPVGTIAAQLRVHHGTVKQVLSEAGVPAALPTARPSIVDPYRAFILETLGKYPTLRASRLYRMVCARGYTGAPDHFRAIIAQLRPPPSSTGDLQEPLRH